MKSTHLAALMLAAVACAGAAQAQTTIVTQPGPPVVTVQPPIVLTPTQQQVIYQGIETQPLVQQQVTVGAATPVVEYQVGAVIPTSTTLYPLPQTVVTEVPAVSSYRYTVINKRAWLVDPANHRIVAEVIKSR